MKGDVFNECKYKGDCSLKLNMGVDVTLGSISFVCVTFSQV